MKASEYLTANAPCCPHCAKQMSFITLGDTWMEGRFENSFCRCWWKGCQDGVYTHQVIRDLTDDEIVAAASAAGEADPQSFINARREAVAAAQGERDFKAALKIERQNADIAKVEAAAEAAGFTARKTLKQQWAGHWSCGDKVVIADKWDGFKYVVGGHRKFGSVDADEFLKQFSASLSLEIQD